MTDFCVKSEREFPYHFEKPAFFNGSSEIIWGKQKYFFYLDLSTHDKVLGAYFSAPKKSYWFPYLSALCRWLDAKRLQDLDFEEFIEMVGEDLKKLLFLPHALFLKALNQLKMPPYHCDLVAQETSSLVCRCFGVYRQELVDFAKEKKVFTLRGVTDETMAGGGCTQCSGDIRGILEYTRDFYGLVDDEDEANGLIKGMYPAQIILLIDQFLQNFTPKLEIISLKSYDLYLKLEDDASVSVEEVQDYLREELAVGFNVRILP